MPKFDANIIIKQGHKRYFYQLNGASPNNTLLYGGQSGQFLNIESVDNPRSGGRSRINVQDPRHPGKFKSVGRENSPPDLPSATVQFMQHQGAIPRSLYSLGECRTTFFEVNGNCKDPSDFINGWSDYVKVLSNGEQSDGSEGGGAFDGDSSVMDDLDFEFDAVYPVGALGFGEKAATEVYSEVIDVVYGSRAQCAGCGPDDDGTSLIYAVSNNVIASPGEAPSLVYSTDGGATWNTAAITGSASTDVPRAIDIVGSYLVVLYDDGAGGGYFVAEINRLTGVPGTWTQVSTGFVSGGEPQDMFVESASSVWFVGDGGYIYQSTSILSGVSVKDAGDATSNDLNRIDGFGETLVAVGDSNTVVFSTNGGKTWGTTTNSPGSAALTALSVVTEFLWWTGNASGAVYYTETQGETAWTQATLPAASTALATIEDIMFINDEVGYISAASSSPTAFLLSTWNGGRDWAVSTNSGTPRLQNYPTFDRGNRLAAPVVDNQGIAANNLAVAGLAGNGADGIVLLGVAGVK